MIEGLKIRVPSAELANHLKARAEYHRGRAATKEAELPALRDAIAKVKSGTQLAENVSQMSKGGYRMDDSNPVEGLEVDIREHRNKAVVFDYLALHLFDEDYTLQEADLIRLEIVKRF